jgi:hypothetical protein
LESIYSHLNWCNTPRYLGTHLVAFFTNINNCLISLIRPLQEPIKIYSYNFMFFHFIFKELTANFGTVPYLFLFSIRRTHIHTIDIFFIVYRKYNTAVM